MKKQKRKKLFTMNKKQNADKDPLKRYIDHRMIENAPEGFTSRVMSLVQLETVPVKTENSHENLRIPILSVLVTIVLIGLALITGGKNEALQIPVPELIKGIKISFPDINSIFSINLPSTLIYVFAGLLVLALFDTVLKSVFHRHS